MDSIDIKKMALLGIVGGLLLSAGAPNSVFAEGKSVDDSKAEMNGCKGENECKGSDSCSGKDGCKAEDEKIDDDKKDSE